MKEKVKTLWNRLPKIIRVLLSLYVLLAAVQIVFGIAAGIMSRLPAVINIIIIIGVIIAIPVYIFKRKK